MSATRLNFTQWRERVKESPESIVDEFLNQLKALSERERRPWVAAIPTRNTLLKTLQAAMSEKGEQGLAGVPYMLQDLFDVKNLQTSCGSPFTAPFEAPVDSSCLLHQKLQTLGACFFGKTTPAEFGVDLQGANPTDGDCKHSDGQEFISGGGAGGAARAVKDGLVPLSFGIDTAGGIRIPAAFNGLFGFRMVNNNYAREGVFPIVPSIESVGWINHCIEDLATTFKAFHHVSKLQQIKEPHGYLICEVSSLVDTDIKAGLFSLCRSLDIGDDPAIGTQLRHKLSGAGTAYKTLEARELYSIHQYWYQEHRQEYAPPLLRRIKQGMHCQPSEAEGCAQSQQATRACLTEFFEKYDYLVLPISPIPTPKKDEWSEELEHEIIQLIAPASLAFLPALILPFECKNGRHSAAQIIINPRKLYIVPQIIAKVTSYYEESDPEESGPEQTVTEVS